MVNLTPLLFKCYSGHMIEIGISGWTYKGWRGTFYPKKLSHSKELEFASRELPTIEINGTFYSLQRASSY